MTITHANATGVTTSTGARGTSSTTVAYVGVAAGRIGVIFAQCKPTSATWSAVTGWTQIANVTGGTGVDGVDTGPTRLAAWYRLLDGSESGSVTVATTGGTNVTAVMHVLSKTLANWAVPAFVSGSDTGHGANFSAVMGAWSPTLTGGDYVLIGHSSDTDDATAMSSPTLSQTGATFGTVTARNRLGNSDGNDGIITSWSASVSTGTANAPTFGFTWTPSSCGPAIAIRLHEYGPMSTSLVDNFDDNSVAAPPWSGNYGSCTETGGRAHVPCTTTFAGYQTGYYYSFDQVLFQVPVVPSLGGASSECYTAAWVVSASQTGGTDAGFIVDRTTGELRFENRTGYEEPGASAVTYNATSHAWWRMRLSGADLIWETSPDGTGTSWTVQRTATAPAYLATALDCKLLLECHRNSGTNDYAEFDNVNIPALTNWPGAAALSAASGLTAAGVAPVRLRNNAEGGTDTSTVTTGNSGSASGNAWTAVTIGTTGVQAYSATHAAHGALAYRMATGGTAAQTFLTWDSTVLGDPARAYGRTYFYLTSGSQDRELIRWRRDSTQVARLRYSGTTGFLELRQGNNSAPATSGGTGTVALSTGTWYRVEWDIQAGTLINSIYLYAADSTSALETITGNGVFATTGSINEVSFGQFTATASLADLYFDDIVITDAGLPGPAVTGAASLSAASGLTAAATATIGGAAATLAAASDLAAAAIRGTAGAVALSAASGLTAAAVRDQPAATNLAAASALTAASFAITGGAAALSAASGLTAAAVRGQPAAVDLSAASGLSAASFAATTGAATLSAASGLSAAGVLTAVSAVALSGASGLSGSGTWESFAVADLSAGTDLTAAGTGIAVSAVTLSAASGLTAAAVRDQPAAAALSAGTDLLVSSGNFSTAAADLAAAGGLAAAAVRVVPALTALSAASGLAAVAVATLSVTVDLSAAAGLAVAGVPIGLAAVDLAAAAELGAEAVIEIPAAVSLAAAAELITLAGGGGFAGVSLMAASSLTAAALQTQGGAAALTAGGGLVVTGVALRRATVTLTATTSLTAMAARVQALTVVLAAASDLVAQTFTAHPAMVELFAYTHLAADAVAIQKIFAYPHAIRITPPLGAVIRTDLVPAVRRTI